MKSTFSMLVRHAFTVVALASLATTAACAHGGSCNGASCPQHAQASPPTAPAPAPASPPTP